MSYYVVVNYDVINHEMYGRYVQTAGQSLMKYGVKVLAADHEPNDIEGKSGRTLVILECDSEEAAMQWYNSPEYQTGIKLRSDASEGWLRGVTQFVLPDSASE